MLKILNCLQLNHQFAGFYVRVSHFLHQLRHVYFFHIPLALLLNLCFPRRLRLLVVVVVVPLEFFFVYLVL